MQGDGQNDCHEEPVAGTAAVSSSGSLLEQAEGTWEYYERIGATHTHAIRPGATVSPVRMQ